MHFRPDVEQLVCWPIIVFSVHGKQFVEVIVPQGLNLVGSLWCQQEAVFPFGVENGHQLVAGPGQHLQVIIYWFVLHEVTQETHDCCNVPPLSKEVDIFSCFEAQLGLRQMPTIWQS